MNLWHMLDFACTVLKNILQLNENLENDATLTKNNNCGSDNLGRGVKNSGAL